MKKFRNLIVVSSALMLLTSGMVFAGPGGPNPCNDGNCSGTGAFAIDALSYGGGADAALKTIPNGAAGGIAIGGGIAGNQAAGAIWNGTVESSIGTLAGGGGDAYAYRVGVPGADKSIGVGSSSSAVGVTSAESHIRVDPDGKLIMGFIPTAGGAVESTMFGVAGEATLNASGVKESPIFFDSEGYSVGIAGQAAVGGFVGAAGAISGPDYTKKDCVLVRDRHGRYDANGNRVSHNYCGPRYSWRKVYTNVDSEAGAGMGANIEMAGSSYSESYRYVNGDTEGMGTNVGASTVVTSYGFDYDYANGKLAGADAGVRGGFIAGGIVASRTQQTLNNGQATANAVGTYVGAGKLGCDFYGNATGYTATSATPIGANGSIMQSSAGMSITATAGNNVPN